MIQYNIETSDDINVYQSFCLYFIFHHPININIIRECVKLNQIQKNKFVPESIATEKKTKKIEKKTERKTFVFGI